MDILQRMVQAMAKEEVRHFKVWLNSTHSSEERKDVILFDYIRQSGGSYNESYITKKLYGSLSDKNAFYRLKNRLLEDIGQNLAQLHFDRQEVNMVLLHLALYNVFVSRNEPAIALYYLKKAEKKALASESYELLDVIYANFIKLSSDVSEINPEHFIERRSENAIQLNRLRDADQVIAAVTYRLKMSQNFGKRDVGLMKLLDTTIKEFAEDTAIRKSKTFQMRMFRAASQILIQSHNYPELEKYVSVTYQKFMEEHWFDKDNHDTKLQMLIYLINALFKNGKYHESLDYAETLGEELMAFGGKWYDRYMFFYYNALVINYAQIDVSRGLKALDELEREMKGKPNTYYNFFIYLNRANLLFFQRKINAAIQNVLMLYANEHYKKADESLKLKIAVAECIMQYESGDCNTAKKRVEQVIKTHDKLISQKDFERERFVLNLIPKLPETTGKLQSGTSIEKQIRRFVERKSNASTEDAEIIRYRNWLQEKLP